MSEIQEVKSDIREIKEVQGKIMETVNDLRVIVAGNYVTKQEFDESKKENTSEHRWFAGICITIGLFVLGIIVEIVKMR